ncbi:MAG: hypothetical protein O2985_12090, partial [Proteobacteria bacterium]|nr:hypothetical protein [Pseudomonadota bacterium]
TKLGHEGWSIDVCGRLVDIALHHGFRDGVGYRQYLIEAIDAPLWRPSGRSVPKDIDLPRLQTALQQVITGKASASLDYLWAEAPRGPLRPNGDRRAAARRRRGRA